MSSTLDGVVADCGVHSRAEPRHLFVLDVGEKILISGMSAGLLMGVMGLFLC